MKLNVLFVIRHDVGITDLNHVFSDMIHVNSFSICINKIELISELCLTKFSYKYCSDINIKDKCYLKLKLININFIFKLKIIFI